MRTSVPLVSLVFALFSVCLHAETLRHPATLETQIKSTPIGELLREIDRRGDAKRGAIVYFTSPAGCIKCHAAEVNASPLGPNLASLDPKPSPGSIIESLLHPSREIRDGYQSVRLLMFEDRKSVV